MNYFNQQSLLLSIVQFADNKLHGNKGLEIYQQNYLLNAVNALSISYPTIFLLLGNGLFKALTKTFLIKYPKRSYDWALWGQEFPQWLAWHPISTEFEYLCDCARLDWAIHLNSKLNESSINLESIQLIENVKLDELIIRFNNGTHFIKSSYPIVDIYHAHKNNKNPDLTDSKIMLDRGVGQNALVVLNGYNSTVRTTAKNECHWLDMINTKHSIGSAISEIDSSDMSFQRWLITAIQEKLIQQFIQRLP